MSAISLPADPARSGQLRPINVLRDLPAIADLIELCFHSTLDQDGRRYVEQVRSGEFLRWAPRLADVAFTPHTGFVWEQNGKIVGNASLIPFTHHGQRVYLIANVATHPDFRQRGIGRALTEQAMRYARERKADHLWLHVRDDNPGAIRIYTSLGFVERDRRTAWQSTSEFEAGQVESECRITDRPAQAWPRQIAWLQRLYPDDEAWYRRFDWELLSPSLRNALYRFFTDYEVRQWAVHRDGRLQAIVAWTPWRSGPAPLWIAAPPQADEQSLAFLLRHIRRQLFHRRALSVDLPAGMAEQPLRAAGFEPKRTLLWMHASGATK